MILYVVNSIVLSDNSAVENSGTVVIRDPWMVEEDRLTPISYTYDLD